MAAIGSSNGRFALVLSEKEFNELGFEPNHEFEVVKAKPGLWVVVDKGVKPVDALDRETAELEKKIGGLLRGKGLSERVEGKFEKYLNNKELAHFQKMLKEKKIILFKLNESYKHGVYKLPEEIEARKSPSAPQAPADPAAEKKPEDYSLETDGFAVLRNEGEARKASEGLRDQIRAGTIKGLKSFEGDYFLVRVEALAKHRKRLLDYLATKKLTGIENAAKDLNMSKTLIRVVAEFLKEDGEIAEKRKGLYQLIT
ncbi:MAG TPA: hypothetical protein HA252_04995 [Candidatus Diapherotrites archaeon]|uniref:Uncharacterized protein n=1 Tax=Candidatus Iainarchaeum sp. TaxID=3101447 RepID=A0A7J4JNC5_9ARCH|nr:hypothetical protein [Candidatus Diapherotrites archaeon]HIH16736.1 hypothetical protein [Candidatus Diapherotrites archaeon]